MCFISIVPTSSNNVSEDVVTGFLQPCTWPAFLGETPLGLARSTRGLLPATVGSSVVSLMNFWMVGSRWHGMRLPVWTVFHSNFTACWLVPGFSHSSSVTSQTFVGECTRISTSTWPNATDSGPYSMHQHRVTTKKASTCAASKQVIDSCQNHVMDALISALEQRKSFYSLSFILQGCASEWIQSGSKAACIISVPLKGFSCITRFKHPSRIWF